MLEGKRVAVGVCGGIAAYKSAELVSQLVKEGCEVRVAMTRNATHFVGPLTFATISRHKVITSTFSDPASWEVEHVELARWAQAFVVAPCTANVLGKIAMGIADDFLTTCIMASRCPVVLVPAMNAAMWESPAVRRNVEALKRDGFIVIEPETGALACGEYGPGRMPSPSTIVARLRTVLTPKDFSGVKILVTAGPTREHFDPVRFISNPSSGKMGYAIAEAARDRGATVKLISGPSFLQPPEDVDVIRVVSAAEMYQRVMEWFEWCDVVVKAAAVSDYRPQTVERQKIKKGETELTVKLISTTDILAELGKKKGEKVLVGFAAETQDLVQNAREKIKRKNLDLIVVNDVSGTRSGVGFGSDTNAVKLIGSNGGIRDVPLGPKYEVAHSILDLVAELISARRERRAQL
ncbi:MAG TPA: bifunctional phosphopantothenoylcysteine decarboxylase/phosphopantothenate--cysteine ligase CoaBC [Firmicutes bacterium]|nr:bifunctional phosphopantothenoylcysteine decarboxylase/phosphopantothenate--cysteine ligase CoaBC [Bacillota bacterium]